MPDLDVPDRRGQQTSDDPTEDIRMGLTYSYDRTPIRVAVDALTSRPSDELFYAVWINAASLPPSHFRPCRRRGQGLASGEPTR